MRANWKRQDLSLASKGLLGFTEHQAQQMRVRLESGFTTGGAVDHEPLSFKKARLPAAN
jgi:hypothetical protein